MQTVSYQEWLRIFKKRWKQGQHVLLSGPTGSGKTYVAEDIKELRTYLVVIASKKTDETLDNYQGFRKIDKWPSEYYTDKMVLFWRKPKNIEDLEGMREAIYKVLSDVFIIGGWTIYFDDIAFISGTLKMDRQLRMMYTQVRSNNTSLVASVQRPFRVPVEVVSQSSFILLFKTNDDKDIERVAQETGQSVSKLKYQAKQIEQYQFLFIEHGKEPVLVQAKENK